MRQVILDTETTGLEWDLGHRVIEVGCIELLERRVTEKRFHRFVNPERSIDHGALEVHGISAESLLGKPKFNEIAEEFLEFIKGSELVIHNADFDIGFLNNELSLAGKNVERIEDVCSVQDTLQLARQLHPGQRNSLDALCKRYGVDNSHRTLHGAMLDAEILTDVYLAMTGGQTELSFAGKSKQVQAETKTNTTNVGIAGGIQLEVTVPSSHEIELHRKWLDILGDDGLWQDDRQTVSDND
jgi:DNA polymerase-3 subunit epsilon